MSWPAVLKPVRGSGGIGVRMVAGPGDVEAHLAASSSQLSTSIYADSSSRGFLLEEQLIGDPTLVAPGFAPRVSVETLVWGGQHSHLCVTDRLAGPDPIDEAGLCLPSGLAPEYQRELHDLTSAALRALEFDHGMAHTEIMLTAEGPVLIEVNGRPGGAVPDLLAMAGAPNPLCDLGRICLGRAPRLSAGPAKVAAMSMIRADHETAATSRPDVDMLRRVPGVLAVHLLLAEPVESAPSSALVPGTLAAVAFCHAATPDEAASIHRAVQALEWR